MLDADRSPRWSLLWRHGRLTVGFFCSSTMRIDQRIQSCMRITIRAAGDVCMLLAKTRDNAAGLVKNAQYARKQAKNCAVR